MSVGAPPRPPGNVPRKAGTAKSRKLAEAARDLKQIRTGAAAGLPGVAVATGKVAVKRAAKRFLGKKLSKSQQRPRQNPKKPRVLLKIFGIPAGFFIAFAAAGVLVIFTIPNVPNINFGMGGIPTSVPDISPKVLQAYIQAAAAVPANCNMSWSILAGVGKIESTHANNGQVDEQGNTVGNSIIGPPTAYGTAKGPMQFINSTWASWGKDGNGDGENDVYNIFDATTAAAFYLCGVNSISDKPRDLSDPEQLRQALYSYNHSWEYVDEVLNNIQGYDQYGSQGSGSLSFDPADPRLVELLLSNPNIKLDSLAEQDLKTGIVDARVASVVGELAHRYGPITVVVFKGEHTKHVQNNPSKSISYHWCGQAVDISYIAGQPVSSISSSARAAAEFLLRDLGPGLRPAEVGGPWKLNFPGSFTDPGHQHHLHIGYGPPCEDREGSS